MSVKLVTPRQVKTVPVIEMKDGQLGEIVGGGNYLDGTIVQMLKKGYSLKHDLLLTVGSKNGNTWGGNGYPSFQVRLLEAGETIQVEAN